MTSEQLAEVLKGLATRIDSGHPEAGNTRLLICMSVYEVALQLAVANERNANSDDEGLRLMLEKIGVQPGQSYESPPPKNICPMCGGAGSTTAGMTGDIILTCPECKGSGTK